MRLLVVLAIVLAASLAVAQPAPACDVEVVRAPDEVASAITAWMRSEPACRRTLRVRVVETTDGLYVIAQDASGRLHERVVPDGRTAAVLVASWAADDGGAPEDAPPVAAPVVVATVPVPASPSVTPEATAVVVAARPPGRAPQVLDVGGMYTLTEKAGTSLRIGIDLHRLGPVLLGVVVADETTAWITGDGSSVRTTDLQLLARGAIETTWGCFALRGELAAGLVRLSDAMAQGDSTSIMVEGALTAGAWITRDWRLRAGPVLASVPDASFADEVLRGGFDLRLFAGIDRRL